jgi:glycosyltransferase involved in cell wall biosynthesis
MKVLQLGPYPPPYGGVQTNLVAIRSLLRKRGIPCAVINVTRHRKPEADDVYYPSNAAGLLKLLAKLNYNIVHYHFGGMLTWRVLAVAAACTARSSAKSVMTFHSGGFPSMDDGKRLRASSPAAFVLRRFDGMIAVNAEIFGFLQRLGVAEPRLRLISPYSFAHERPAPLPKTLADFFQTHGPVMISAGQLEPEYDLGIQIEALHQLRHKFPKAGLVFLGSGSIEVDLRRKIEALDCREHVLLAGDVPHESALEAISRARLMLRTSLYDGDSISVREALQLGTPVIATDTGMRPPAVTLVPKSDLSALGKAIESVLAYPRKPCLAPQNDESNVQAVLDFYQELLSGDRLGT